MRSLSFHELVFMLTNQISDIIKFPIKLYSMTMVLIFWYYKYWYIFITKSDQTQDLIWADPTLEQYSFFQMEGSWVRDGKSLITNHQPRFHNKQTHESWIDSSRKMCTINMYATNRSVDQILIVFQRCTRTRVRAQTNLVVSTVVPKSQRFGLEKY